MKASWRDGFERLGSTYAAHPLLIWISAPPLILGFIATEVRPGLGLTDIAVIAGVGVAAQLLLLAVLLLGRAVFSRQTAEPYRRAWWAIATYLVAGLVRASFIVWSLGLAELGDELPLWSRLLTSAFLFPLAFGFSSYALESWRLYRLERDQRIASIVKAEHGLLRQQTAVEVLRETFLTSVHTQVNQINTEAIDALTSLEDQLRQGQEVREELRAVQEAADTGWRGVSHEAWKRANISVPQASRREILATISLSRPLSLVALAVSAPFIFALSLGRVLPFWPAVGWTVVWLGLVLLVAAVTNEVASHSRQVGSLVVLLGIVVLGGLGVLFIHVPNITVDQALATFVIHLTALSTSLFVGIGPGLGRGLNRIVDQLDQYIDSKTLERLRVESELQVLAQRIARQLHAESRGHFLAHMTRVRRFLDSGEIDQALSELAVVKEALRSQTALGANEVEDEDLLQFLDNWRGLISIDSNLHTAQVPEEIHPPVNTIVMEAVNDAVRHGGADWVEISLESTSDEAVLTIVNNGSPPGDSPSVGLGSDALDRLAPGQWSRTVDALGFLRLRVVFPLPAQPND